VVDRNFAVVHNQQYVANGVDVIERIVIQHNDVRLKTEAVMRRL